MKSESNDLVRHHVRSYKGVVLSAHRESHRIGRLLEVCRDIELAGVLKHVQELHDRKGTLYVVLHDVWLCPQYARDVIMIAWDSHGECTYEFLSINNDDV